MRWRGRESRPARGAPRLTDSSDNGGYFRLLSNYLLGICPVSSGNARLYAQIVLSDRRRVMYFHHMTASASSSVCPVLGPHSRALRRGSLGNDIDGRSAEGRYLKRCETELIAQLSREPSFAERLLIKRICRAMLRLELFDKKLAEGAWTANDSRTFGGLSNALRLMLRELGLKPSPAKRANPLADHFANPPARSAVR